MLRHLIFYKNLKKTFSFFDAIIIVLLLKLKAFKIYIPVQKRNLYIRKNTKDRETFKEIFNSNIYNIKLPFTPGTIIDAGANTGFASLFFKLKYPNSKIVSLEIEAGNCEMVLKNTENLNDFELKQKALYNRKTYFKIEDPFNATNSFVIKEVGENDGFEIESITLDEILKEKQWETIDLLKIDIEGAEKDLFESNYENWLPKTKVIMIETHDRMIEKCSYTVMKTINDYNFILYTTTEGTLIYYNMDFIKIN